MTARRQITAEALRAELQHHRQAFRSSKGLPELGDLVPLSRKDVADDPIKYRIHSRTGAPLGLAVCSNGISPGLAQRGAEATRSMQQLLGPRLGAAVLAPIADGEVEGLSWAAYPWRLELTDSGLWWLFQRPLIARQVLRWLRDATAAAVEANHRSGEPATFEPPLRHVAERQDVGDEVTAAAKLALDRLSRGHWRPCHTFDHNDFWRGNVMRVGPDPLGPADTPFAIIDWLGANPKGYGFYDLLRFAQSFKLARSTVSREVAAHCRAMGCEPIDARGHLLAALGHLGLHLEHFPRERYLLVVRMVWQTLERAQR